MLPPGVCPDIILCERSQLNHEQNDFNNIVVKVLHCVHVEEKDVILLTLQCMVLVLIINFLGGIYATLSQERENLLMSHTQITIQRVRYAKLLVVLVS